MFYSLGELMSWYNTHNPARQRFFNLFEPESGSNSYASDFSGDSESDIWASITWAIKRALRGRSYLEARSWALRNLNETAFQYSIEEIACDLQKTPKKISRWIRQIDRDLERECIRRELLPAEDIVKTTQLST